MDSTWGKNMCFCWNWKLNKKVQKKNLRKFIAGFCFVPQKKNRGRNQITEVFDGSIWCNSVVAHKLVGKGCIKEIVKLERLSSDNHFSLLPCKKKKRNMAEFPGWEHLIIQVHYGVVLPSFVLLQHQKKTAKKIGSLQLWHMALKSCRFFQAQKAFPIVSSSPTAPLFLPSPNGWGFRRKKEAYPRWLTLRGIGLILLHLLLEKNASGKATVLFSVPWIITPEKTSRVLHGCHNFRVKRLIWKFCAKIRVPRQK